MRRDLAIVMATIVSGGCTGDLTSGMPDPQVDADPNAPDADPGAPDADETQQGMPDGPPAQLDDVAYCMSEINEYRASIGLPAYGRAADIDAFAAEGAMIDGTAHEAHKHFSDTNGGNGIAFAENEIPWWNDN